MEKNNLLDMQSRSMLENLSKQYHQCTDRNELNKIKESYYLLQDKFNIVEKLDAISVVNALKELYNVDDGVAKIFSGSNILVLNDRKVFDYIKFRLKDSILPEGKNIHYLTNTFAATFGTTDDGTMDFEYETIYFCSNPYLVVQITLSTYRSKGYVFTEPVYRMELSCTNSSARFILTDDDAKDEEGYTVSILGSSENCGFKNIKINENPKKIIENKFYLSRWIGHVDLNDLIEYIEKSFSLEKGQSRIRE